MVLGGVGWLTKLARPRVGVAGEVVGWCTAELACGLGWQG